MPDVGWQSYTASLVSSLAWPVAAVIAGWFLRGHLPAMLERVQKIKVPGAEIELGAAAAAEIERAASDVVRTNIDRDEVLEVPQRVLEAADYELPTDEIRRRLDSEIRQDEEQRRTQVQSLVQHAADVGWYQAQAGFGRPVLRLSWDAEGRASVASAEEYVGPDSGREVNYRSWSQRRGSEPMRRERPRKRMT
jgi:hypothetical protein